MNEVKLFLVCTHCGAEKCWHTAPATDKLIAEFEAQGYIADREDPSVMRDYGTYFCSSKCKKDARDHAAKSYVGD
jgi:hypothetical protein